MCGRLNGQSSRVYSGSSEEIVLVCEFGIERAFVENGWNRELLVGTSMMDVR